MVILAWQSVSFAASYVVYDNGQQVATLGSGATCYQANGYAIGDVFKVVALNSAGTQIASATTEMHRRQLEPAYSTTRPTRMPLVDLLIVTGTPSKAQAGDTFTVTISAVNYKNGAADLACKGRSLDLTFSQGWKCALPGSRWGP